MSENIPESVPASSDRRSHRPIKKRALSPTSTHSKQIDALFANPDRQVSLPLSADERASIVAKRAMRNAPPEIVANVQGSSAGAGSGEFHVYKASRRREFERLRAMDDQVKKEENDREFEEKKEELRRRDEANTIKKKARRDKAKARKEKARGGGAHNGNGKKAINGKISARADLPTSNGGEIAESDLPTQAGNEVAAIEEHGIVIHDDD